MLSLHFLNLYPPQRHTSGLFHFAKQLASEFQNGAPVAEAVSAGGSEGNGSAVTGSGVSSSNGSPSGGLAAKVSEFPLDGLRTWWDIFRTAAGRRATGDVSVFQFSPHLFRRHELAPFALLLLTRRLQGLPSVLVWHDANARNDPNLGRAAALSYSLLPSLVDATCVFSEQEAQLFEPSPHVIPHFIRPRPRVDKADARRALGLSEHSRIGGVLGFVHPRKGHDRTLELLQPDGPLDELIFAGESGSEDYSQRLASEVNRRGLTQRVHFTGYLTEEAFSLWGSACDVGLCPFTDVSASGSLSDWVSLRRPVVAQDLPQLRFYSERSGSSVRLVDTASPDAFRAEVARALDATFDDSAWNELLDELSVASVARQHAQVAQQARAKSHRTLAGRVRDIGTRLFSPLPHSP